MKIAVYAISKNESKFAERWMKSMREADEVYVLDTGSDDDTAKKLRSLGAIVKTEAIVPWRFDVARNRSMDMLPEDVDVCVCTDLDEVFRPGWRKALERAWVPGTDRATYEYAWSMKEDGTPGIRAEGVFLEHYPDKTKSRAQYLSLLELSVVESPEDDRNMHYLGREYMFRGRWDDCITTLRRHLTMPGAVWKDERAASMRFIAHSLHMKGKFREARDEYLRAIAEAPHLREPYVDLSELLYELKEWYGVLYFTECALRITVRPETYICEAKSWGSLPHDLRAIAFYNTGMMQNALDEAEKALSIEPDNERLKNNVTLIRNEIRG